MNRLALRTIWIVVLVVTLSMVCEASTQQGADDAKPSEGTMEESIAAPELSDLVPSATELSRRLDLLGKRISDALNVSAVEKSYAEILTNLKAHSSRVKTCFVPLNSTQPGSPEPLGPGLRERCLRFRNIRLPGRHSRISSIQRIYPGDR